MHVCVDGCVYLMPVPVGFHCERQCVVDHRSVCVCGATQRLTIVFLSFASAAPAFNRTSSRQKRNCESHANTHSTWWRAFIFLAGLRYICQIFQPPFLLKISSVSHPQLNTLRWNTLAHKPWWAQTVHSCIWDVSLHKMNQSVINLPNVELSTGERV